MAKTYEVKSHNVVYKGKIINIYHDEVVLEKGQLALREVVEHVGAAAVLLIDNDGKLILIKQYRHPTKEVILEIPAGTLDYKETPLDCARRELEEETGKRANNLKYMTKIYPAVGYSSEVIYIYLGTELEDGKQNLDPDEFVVIEKYTLDEAMEMIKNNIIMDSKTIIAIMYYNSIINL